MSDIRAVIKGDVIFETELAIKIKVRKKTIWVAKSLIKKRLTTPDEPTELTIPEWVAQEKGVWYD